jgi:hypothetical protein
LIPKKAKEFKKPVAEDLNLSEELVNDVINFYWEKVRKLITTVDENSVEILNLGTFKLKTWKIDETTSTYKNIIERLEGKFGKYAIKREYEYRLEILEKAKEFAAEEKERLTKIKQERYASKDKDNLEEQASDT